MYIIGMKFIAKFILMLVYISILTSQIIEEHTLFDEDGNELDVFAYQIPENYNSNNSHPLLAAFHQWGGNQMQSRFLKNSKTLKAFKSFPISVNFENQKDKLIKNIDLLDKIYSEQITHQLYGKIKTKLFKRLMFFHTKYHFNQFRILNQ